MCARLTTSSSPQASAEGQRMESPAQHRRRHRSTSQRRRRRGRRRRKEEHLRGTASSDTSVEEAAEPRAQQAEAGRVGFSDDDADADSTTQSKGSERRGGSDGVGPPESALAAAKHSGSSGSLSFLDDHTSDSASPASTSFTNDDDFVEGSQRGGSFELSSYRAGDRHHRRQHSAFALSLRPALRGAERAANWIRVRSAPILPTSWFYEILDAIFGIFPTHPRGATVEPATQEVLFASHLASPRPLPRPSRAAPPPGPDYASTPTVASVTHARQSLHPDVDVSRRSFSESVENMPEVVTVTTAPSKNIGVSLPGFEASDEVVRIEIEREGAFRTKFDWFWVYVNKAIEWFQGPYEEWPPRESYSQLSFPGIDPRAWPPPKLPFFKMLLLWWPWSRYGFHFETISLWLQLLSFLLVVFGLYWILISPTSSIWDILSGEMGTSETRGYHYFETGKWPIIFQLVFSACYALAQLVYHWYNVYSDQMWVRTMHVMTIFGALAGVVLELPYLEYSFCADTFKKFVQYGIYFSFVIGGYALVRWRRWLRPEAYPQRTWVFLGVGVAILLMKTVVNIWWLGGNIWDVVWRSALVLFARAFGAWVNGTRFPELYTWRKWSSYVMTSSHLLIFGSAIAFALDFANSIDLLEFAARKCGRVSVFGSPPD